MSTLGLNHLQENWWLNSETFCLRDFVRIYAKAVCSCSYYNHGGIINGAERGVNCVKTSGGRRAYIVNITSSRRTVQLGSFLGEYERLLIRNLIR